MTGPSEPSPPAEPRSLDGAMIAVPLHCCRCTYDLRGLPADGRCPECGLEIHFTLQHLVDPASSHLPRLADPLGVGNAMFWLALCCFGAALMLVVQSVVLWLGLSQPRQVGAWGIAAAHDMTLVASAAGLAAMWSVIKFSPAKHSETSIAVRFDVWLLGIGLAAWSILTLILWQRERQWAFAAMAPEVVAYTRAVLHMGMALAAATTWIGMQRILKTIGRRSRAYRRAHGGRQGVRPMLAATVGIMVGSALRFIEAYTGMVEALAMLGTVLVHVSMLMIVIGLCYLLINAWWIRQALRHPPPKLGDLLRKIP